MVLSGVSLPYLSIFVGNSMLWASFYLTWHGQRGLPLGRTPCPALDPVNKLIIWGVGWWSVPVSGP
jgi:hypothetical protein